MEMVVEAPVVDVQSELRSTIGQTYLKDRFGTKTAVTLKEVKAHKVVLQYKGHTETFSISFAEFKKFYHLR